MQDFEEDMSSKIDDYLLDRLSKNDREAFEAVLYSNLELQQDVIFRSMLMDALWVGKQRGVFESEFEDIVYVEKSSRWKALKAAWDGLSLFAKTVAISATSTALAILLFMWIKTPTESTPVETRGDAKDIVADKDPVATVDQDDLQPTVASQTIRSNAINLSGRALGDTLSAKRGNNEEIDWSAALQSNSCEGFKSFIRNYPKSDFRPVAERYIDQVCKPFPLESLPFPIQKLQADMVHVKGGEFLMGCQEDGDTTCLNWSKPSHLVRVSDFALGRYEVTQAQWRAVLGADPPTLLNKGCNNCPVEGVSWVDAMGFIEKLNQLTNMNFRLPSEAEWEFAARGGVESKGYRYSGSDNLEEVAWSGTFNIKKSQPVGTKKPNELGLYDMSGNVYEWVQDCFNDSYENAPNDGTAWQSSGNCELRVARGGSWNPNDPSYYCTPTFRLHFQYKLGILGFRLASDK